MRDISQNGNVFCANDMFPFSPVSGPFEQSVLDYFSTLGTSFW